MKSLMVFNSANLKNWLIKISNGEYDEIFLYRLKERFKEGKPIRNLSLFLELPYNTVKNWFNNEKPKPSSEALYKIFDKFPELKYEDLGVKEVDTGKNVTSFVERLGQLMNEKGSNNTSLAKKLNLDKSSISSWRNGYSMPSEENLIKLANLFNVSTEFLLGTTNIRKNYDKNTKIAHTLEKIAPDANVELYGKITTAKDLEEQFDDIPEYLLDVNLIGVFQEEVKRIVDYYMDENFYNNFENIVNDRNVDGLPVAFSQQCSAIDVSLLNINKSMDSIFDKYVNKKLTELGISAEEIKPLNKEYYCKIHDEIEKIFDKYVKKILIKKGVPEKYIGNPDKYHLDNKRKRHQKNNKK